MIFILLIFVVILTLLALYFMREAIEQQEFSLMWAGVLMAAAAAGTVGVYLVAGNYTGYMMRSHDQVAIEQAYDSIRWYVEAEEASEPQVYVSDAVVMAPKDKNP